MIQVYAQFGDYFSFSNISRAYCKVMKSFNIPFMVWSIDKAIETRYLDCPFPNGLDADAPIAMAIAYPTVALQHLASHEKKILITVCESDRIPPDWVKACNMMDLIVVPSWFCLNAFRNSGVTKPIIRGPHGVDNNYLINTYTKPEGFALNETWLLHVSGAISFHKRKGTFKLLRAFSNLKDEFPNTYLHLITAPTEGLLKVLKELEIENRVRIISKPLGFHPKKMAELLTVYDAIIQPSRGEGFGIVPLEARCLGIPVIMTACTGHSDHADECDTIIKHGNFEHLETQGNSFGNCPIVSTEDVEASLRYALPITPQLSNKTLNWAKMNSHKWTWRNVLTPAMKEIKKLFKDCNRPIKLGSTAGIG